MPTIDNSTDSVLVEQLRTDFDIPRIDVLGNQQLRTGGIYLVTGPAKSGKTTLALGLAAGLSQFDYPSRADVLLDPVRPGQPARKTLFCTSKITDEMRNFANPNVVLAEVKSIEGVSMVLEDRLREGEAPFLLVLDNLPGMLKEDLPTELERAGSKSRQLAELMPRLAKMAKDGPARKPMAIMVTLRSESDDKLPYSMSLLMSASMIIRTQLDGQVKVTKNRFGLTTPDPVQRKIEREEHDRRVQILRSLFDFRIDERKDSTDKSNFQATPIEGAWTVQSKSGSDIALFGQGPSAELAVLDLWTRTTSGSVITWRARRSFESYVFDADGHKFIGVQSGTALSVDEKRSLLETMFRKLTETVEGPYEESIYTLRPAGLWELRHDGVKSGIAGRGTSRIQALENLWSQLARSVVICESRDGSTFNYGWNGSTFVFLGTQEYAQDAYAALSKYQG